MSEIQMNNAIERQQYMLVQTIPTRQQISATRALQHERYISLLSTCADTRGRNVEVEFAALATKFALTQSYKEAVAIIDAGGDVYGF